MAVPKISDLHKIVAGQHDVRRLDIAMHDVVVVRELQRGANLLHDAQEGGEAKSSRPSPAWIAGFLRSPIPWWM